MGLSALKKIPVIFCCILPLHMHAQDVRVSGGFLADSLRIGDEIFFSLSARYGKDQQVLFPDSSYNYGSFEFKKKRYFITKTSNGISIDSAVYHLTSFELDSVQRLRLPVYQVNALDCTRYYCQWDTVKLNLMIKVLPENVMMDLPVRATIGYQSVSKRFNYPLVIVLTSFTVLLGGILWMVFGTKINRHYRIKRMTKSHLQFVNAYRNGIERVKSGFSPEVTEEALVLWKKYMEQLNKKPYTKLTTQETRLLEKNEDLAKDLQIVDAAIFGSNKKVVSSLVNLGNFADERFSQIIEEVNHGE